MYCQARDADWGLSLPVVLASPLWLSDGLVVSASGIIEAEAGTNVIVMECGSRGSTSMAWEMGTFFLFKKRSENASSSNITRIDIKTMSNMKRHCSRWRSVSGIAGNQLGSEGKTQIFKKWVGTMWLVQNKTCFKKPNRVLGMCYIAVVLFFKLKQAMESLDFVHQYNIDWNKITIIPKWK